MRTLLGHIRSTGEIITICARRILYITVSASCRALESRGLAWCISIIYSVHCSGLYNGILKLICDPSPPLPDPRPHCSQTVQIESHETQEGPLRSQRRWCECCECSAYVLLCRLGGGVGRHTINTTITRCNTMIIYDDDNALRGIVLLVQNATVVKVCRRRRTMRVDI